MNSVDTSRKNLKKFSITMFIALAVIGTALLLKHKGAYVWIYLAGGLFFIAGLAAVDLLKPAYIVWMKIAFILSWVNTRIILLLMFYLIFTPLGLIMKIFRKDPLHLKTEKDKISYWEKRLKKPFSKLDYHRQF